METISQKLTNGIMETIKIEGVGMMIGITIYSLFLILMGLELLVIYLFAVAIFVSFVFFPGSAVFFILLNEYYEMKQLRNGITF